MSITPFPVSIRPETYFRDSGTKTYTMADRDDVPALAAALQALDLQFDRRQYHGELPFLLRNLRKGFKVCCEKEGIPTDPDQPHLPVQVLFRARSNPDEADEELFEQGETKMLTWSCPVCDLHGRLDNGNMLNFHLNHDHPELHVTWQQVHDAQVRSSLTSH